MPIRGLSGTARCSRILQQRTLASLDRRPLVPSAAFSRLTRLAAAPMGLIPGLPSASRHGLAQRTRSGSGRCRTLRVERRASKSVSGLAQSVSQLVISGAQAVPVEQCFGEAATGIISELDP